LRRAFVVDFDGTIAKEDIGYSIVQNFARDGWQEWEEMWIDNKITTPMLAETQWNMLQASPQDVLNFASELKLNEGFEDFYKTLKKKDYRIIIASEGFDFYIDPVLRENGFENLEVISSHLEYKDGWEFKYPHASESCEQCGNCKKEVVNKLKKDGYKVYYAGDGYSDRCASHEADVVFAKSLLAKYCRDNGIPYTQFEDFHQILGNLENGN
jgi:2-hydroxy-3-keto-5-methylthiopentenyl-1-phosphate phosphatase